MTFDEPELIETALESAFKRAGGNPDLARLKVLVVTHRGNPMGLLKRFATERKSWLLLCEILERCIEAKAPASPQPRARAVKRDHRTEQTPAAKVVAKRIAEKYRDEGVTAFLMRDGRNIETVYLDEARRLITENTLEARILGKVLNHCGGKSKPGMTIRECVNAETLARFVREAREEQKAPA